MTYKGVVKDNTVVFDEPVKLPEGTEVLVTPVELTRGSPQAVLAAMKSPPHLKKKDVEELRRLIKAGRLPTRYENPLHKARGKSKK